MRQVPARQSIQDAVLLVIPIYGGSIQPRGWSLELVVPGESISLVHEHEFGTREECEAFRMEVRARGTINPARWEAWPCSEEDLVELA